jgi:hypothetical protein
MSPPDNPMIIFIDQVVSVQKKGNGCMVKTSDGVENVFWNVSFETMRDAVLKGSE